MLWWLMTEYLASCLVLYDSQRHTRLAAPYAICSLVWMLARWLMLIRQIKTKLLPTQINEMLGLQPNDHLIYPKHAHERLDPQAVFSPFVPGSGTHRLVTVPSFVCSWCPSALSGS